MAVQRLAFSSQKEMINDPRCYDSRKSYTCPECGSEMNIVDCGEFRGIDWENLECPDCGYKINDEPDWDLMYQSKKECQ